MKICAIICEYNPFHTGHAYQINEALGSFDRVVCLMSGNFVQRAEPAIVERHVRAAAALNAGASLVAELPIIYATANGERFASGAVSILARLPHIDALVMGCEADDASVIPQLAAVQSDETGEFKAALDLELAKGRSYAAAIAEATAAVAEKRGIHRAVSENILSGSNNLLCIEYVKSLARIAPHIKPVFIRRKGNSFNDRSAFGDILSATALRELISSGRFTEATPYLGSADTILAEARRHRVNFDLFSRLETFALRTHTTAEIATAPDCREGLEFKLAECAARSLTISETLAAAKSKRYTMRRLQRVALEVLLGIDRDLVGAAPYIPPRLLAIAEDFKPYLAEAGDKFVIRGTDLERDTDAFFARYVAVEKRAAALYSLLSDNPDDLYSPKKLYSI